MKNVYSNEKKCVEICSCMYMLGECTINLTIKLRLMQPQGFWVTGFCNLIGWNNLTQYFFNRFQNATNKANRLQKCQLGSDSSPIILIAILK